MSDLSERIVALGVCYACGTGFTFDAETVCSVYVDPQTNLPPDVGGTDPANARKLPLCDPCVDRIEQVWKDQGKASPFRRRAR